MNINKKRIDFIYSFLDLEIEYRIEVSRSK